MKPRPTRFRNAMIQKIHAAARALTLDDDTYRDMLHRVTGKRSCADMNTVQLEAVSRELDRLQGNARPQSLANGPVTIQEGCRAMMTKVERLLISRDRQWEYAHSMARHMFKVDRVEWLRPADLHKLVAALEIDSRRRSKAKAP
ncbi:gp16 family protein [Ahniella affigens]|nr:regulatory protein GemA [Ahniella affigens]